MHQSYVQLALRCETSAQIIVVSKLGEEARLPSSLGQQADSGVHKSKGLMIQFVEVLDSGPSLLTVYA